MGTHVIKMPDIGEGIAEVELSQWHVKVGDLVVEDQVLADVMTDKAMVDIPSPVHGKVIALGGQPGEVMAVGSILISIEVEGAGNLKESDKPAPKRSIDPAPDKPRGLRATRDRPGRNRAPDAIECPGPAHACARPARRADAHPLREQPSGLGKPQPSAERLEQVCSQRLLQRSAPQVLRLPVQEQPIP